ncbi:TadE/TadG family type IV pilus assembly protein [Stappia sp.]|uniref:TadE/TadG family type IV pilus assembly protein n=1 Tax=Stappia sp. TaxID=1870903 RepID=UPI0032D93EA2
MLSRFTHGRDHPTRPRRIGFRRRFSRDRRGVAAVEFALVLPFMLLLFLGMIDMNSALTVDRKVSQATQSLADLVSQTDRLTNAQINDLLRVSEAVLDPYPSAPLKLVVASIRIHDVNKPRVEWSRASHTAAWATNTAPPIQIPDALTQQKGSYLIVTHASYAHRPSFAAILKDVFDTDTITLEDTYFMRPRVSTSVTCCN